MSNSNYIIGYAMAYRVNEYRDINAKHVLINLEKMTEEEFIIQAKEIINKHHPVRFVYFEHIKNGILAIYRNDKITVNKRWIDKKEDETIKTDVIKSRKKRTKKV